MNFIEFFKLTRTLPKDSQQKEDKGILQYIKHIPDFIRLYWRLFRDKRIPSKLKLMLIGSLIYFISPLDLIPEMFIWFIGYIDDGFLLVLAFRYFILWSPQYVVKEKILEIEEENRLKQAKNKT
ncbi:MAG TPA: DUF1232 domain-containing protein [Firmicutes bacterium]|nr:DUF1232 domain-containing protein [Bacillota bacterium]